MEFPLPQMIGRYPVESVIGRGAMGVVYLGRDPSIGRAVAIKVLDLSLAPTERAKQDFLHRFRREAQTAGRLTHPSIVTIYEAGSDPASGQPFIAMEYLTGRGLHDIIAEGALPIEKAVNILYDLVNALDHAHRQGIVHRDVKPSNILITSAGFTKIMDFGIARLEASDITHAGEFLGTPAYMSPEQAAGKTADARSDLFSLGILGYEMLTGERPFKAESVTGILAQISSHHPNPPSHLRPEIPRALDRVILKLLEKDPERRYPDGASAALELARLRPTQVIEAPPADPLATAQRAQVPAAPPAANSHAGVAIAAALGVAVGALGWLQRTPAVKPLSVSAPVPVSAPASTPAPASVPAPIPAPASSIAPSPASPPAPRTSAPAPVPPRPQPPKPVAGSGEIRLVFERPAKPGRYLVRAGDRQIASIAFAKGDTRAAKYQTVNWPAGPLTITASFDPDGGGAMQRAEKKITLEAGKSRVVSFSTGGLFRKDQLKIKD